jgi:hypothetical protein
VPDLISHAATAYIFRNLASKLRVCQKPFFVLVLLGVFLPDLISRATLVFFPKLFYLTQYFHTPFSCFFQTIIISCFFIKSQRLIVFYAITIGWVIHQTLDVLQGFVGGGNYVVLWPFSNKTFGFGLFPATEWMYVILITTLTALLTNKLFIKKE